MIVLTLEALLAMPHLAPVFAGPLVLLAIFFII
jgi:hypothetical protein